MAENPTLKMSAFADCDSNSIVLRVPYELAVAMLKHLPRSEEKTKLMTLVTRAAQRSKLLSRLLKEEVDADATDSKK